METFRFINFPVYTQAKNLYKEILKATHGIKDFSLRDQIRRATLSIVLNIAEGSARKSDKEFARFLQVSLGSVNEVFACLDLLIDNNLISKQDFDRLKNACEEIAKQLGGLSKKLTP